MTVPKTFAEIALNAFKISDRTVHDWPVYFNDAGAVSADNASFYDDAPMPLDRSKPFVVRGKDGAMFIVQRYPQSYVYFSLDKQNVVPTAFGSKLAQRTER